MEFLFLGYPNCDTSRKALKWLRTNGIEADFRNIVTENPKVDELTRWISRSGLPVRKFFNTSGVRYKELRVKEKIGTATDEELIMLLASDGKLVKRPLLVSCDRVWVGFREKEWSELLR